MQQRRWLTVSIYALFVLLLWGLSGAVSQTAGPTVSMRLAPGTPQLGIPTLDLQSLSFAEARAFVEGLQNDDVIEVPFPGGAGVDDLDLVVQITFDATTRSIDFVGTGSLGSLPEATIAMTAIWPEDPAAEPDVLLGVLADNFALNDLGLVGELSDIVFPNVAFVLPAVNGGGGTLPSSSLSPDLLDLLAQAFPDTGGAPEFEIDLDAGLQFAGTVPLDRLPDRVREVLVVAPGAEVGFEGRLGLDFQLLRGEAPVSLSGFELTATLPELGPVADLDWVDSDPLVPTTLHLAYLNPAWEIEIASTLLAEVGGSIRTFEIGAMLDLDNVGAALHLEGAMASVWNAPFGVSRLSLDTVLLEIDIDDAGNVNGAITARIGVMPLGDLGDLMLGAVQASGVDIPNIDLPELDAPTIDNFELSLSGGTAGVGLSASASVAFLGRQATLFFSVARDFDDNTQLLTGLELPDFKLSELGFDGPLSGFRFPSISFVLPRASFPQIGDIKISSKGLSDRITDIIRDAYPDQPLCGECPSPPGENETPEFVLELSPGVNLAASLPVDIVADALPGLRNVLGTTPGAEVLFEGALGLDLTIFSSSAPSIDLDLLELRLSVSGLAPSLLPAWLEHDPRQPTRFHVLYQRPNLSAELESGLRALIDGEFRTFLLASAIDLTDGSESLTLSGVMTSEWLAPFGVAWLDLDEVGISLSAEAGGTLSGELQSMFTLGSGPLAKDLAIAIQLEVGPGGQVGGEIWARADSLGIADLEALLTQAGSSIPFPALPELAIENAQIALSADNSGPSITLLGSTTVPGLNAPADMLFSLLPDDGGGAPRIITGFQLRDFGLGQLVPSLDGTMVGDFELPSLNLVLSGGGSGGSSPTSSVPAGELSAPAREFFSGVYGTPDFDVSLKTGINLLAALPDVGPAIGGALDTLGANGGSVLQGSIPSPIPGFGAGGALEVDLRAELPPMSPSLPNGAQPPWFRQGQVAFFISVGAGSFAAGLDGTLDVFIDNTPMRFYVSGEFAGPPIAITVSGGLIAEEPWIAPFGIGWLTINQLGLNLSFNPVTQSLGLGFIGDGVIVEKDLAVRGDLAISLTTGVPTNFVFDGESESQFGLSDLAALQAQMRTAAFPDDPPPPAIDLSQLGDVQIRPVSAEQPIRVKFALRRSPNVEPGFALSGALWATLNGSLEELAAVDAALGIEGVFLFAQVPQDLTLGEFTLADPTVDIDLVPLPPDASFFVAGDVETPWSTKHVEINLGRDNAQDVLDQLSAVVGNATALVSAIANDPVGALRTALRPLFDAAERVEPPWLTPLLAAIDEVEALVSGVTPEELLDFALAGVVVGSPEGIPAGGLAKICAATTPIFEDGRCWLISPSMTNDIGFQLECPVLTVESGGQCWVLPIGPPRYSADRFPESCGLWGNITCCKPFHPEAVRILEGGRCWLTPPSITATVPKVSICLGFISGNSCLGTPAIPEGGADLECPLVAPLEDAGRCYAVPPNVNVTVGGVCTALEIGCSVSELLSQDVIPAATRATNDKLDEFQPPAPPNAPPIANAGDLYNVDEGATVVLSAAASFDPEGEPIEVNWDLDDDGAYETLGVEALFDAATLNGPDLIEVAFEVNDGEKVSQSTALVVVANAAPLVLLPSDLYVASGGTLLDTAEFSDPGPDTWEATIDFGDGATSPIHAVDPSTGVTLFHAFPEDGAYDLTVEVVDSDGAVGVARTRILVPEPQGTVLSLVALGCVAVITHIRRRRTNWK
jgi:hypothetical protein